MLTRPDGTGRRRTAAPRPLHRAFLPLALATCALAAATSGAATPAPAATPPATAPAAPPALSTAQTLARIRTHARAWSAHPRWRALHAGNLGERHFVVPGDRERGAPALELLRFARRALSPAPGLADDDLPACREPVRWQVLQELADASGVPLPSAPTCTALRAFTDPARTFALELLFVAPTTAKAAASFGHVLLRLRRRAPGEPEGARDVAYEVSAHTGFRHTTLSYLAGGLSGRFPLVFDPRPLHTVVAQIRHGEQRHIQRISLNLTAPQRRAVLRLLWQVERTLVLPYRFLNRNCGTYVLWLLATALDGQVALPVDFTLWAAPAAVLDALSAVTMSHDGRPLAGHEPGGWESSGATRLRALRARLDAEDGLRRVLPRALFRQLRRFEQRSPPELRTLTQQAIAHAPAQAPRLLAQLLTAATLAARARADEGRAAAQEVDAQRVQPLPGQPLPGVAEVMAWRRRLYRHEAPSWRRQRRIDRVLWTQAYARKAPRRPATRSERATLTQATAAWETFERVTARVAAVADLLPAAPALEDTWRRQAQRAARARWRGRLVRGPAGPVTVGAGGDRTATWLTVGAAFWREELGQLRPHGLGGVARFVVADVDTHIGVSGDGVTWLGNTARLFEFARMLAAPAVGPLRGLPGVGWGLALNASVTRERVALQGRLDGYLLLRDGLHSRWLAGARLGARPCATRHAGLSVSGDLVAEAFAQLRVGATGRVALRADYARSWRSGVVTSALDLDLPWGARESWRTLASAALSCPGRSACTPSWRLALSW